MIFVHRFKCSNIGDKSCCPADYFCGLSGPRFDILDVGKFRARISTSKIVIVGGGGLFYFRKQLNELLDLDVSVIGWGIGTNTHGATEPVYDVDLDKFSLLGLRDVDVPCVSCMSVLFDSPPQPTHDIVFYRHLSTDLSLPYPTAKNNTRRMADALTFLASGRTVITNTYHGWYWATLLGRRVVIYRPFSSRFFGLPWPCPIAHDEAELPEKIGQATAYPYALDEARAKNRAFFQRFRAIL